MKHTKLAWTMVMAAFAVSMAAAPAVAKGGGGSAKVKTPKPAAAAKAKPASVKPKAQAPKAQAPKAVKPAKAAKPAKATKAQSKTTTPTLTSAKRESQPPSLSANGPTDTDPGPTVKLNKAQQLLLKNDNLRLKVQTRLGSDPIAAASGFRNLGQFVAAVNASYNNPGISFKALRALMTGPEQMSLGQAMKQLKGMDPAAANTAANRAMAQADADILAAR